jgi:hypothetical protein
MNQRHTRTFFVDPDHVAQYGPAREVRFMPLGKTPRPGEWIKLVVSKARAIELVVDTVAPNGYVKGDRVDNAV